MLRGVEQFGLLLSQAADGGRSGRVRISAPPGFARACLLPVLPDLLDAHPEIRLEIRATYDPVDLADGAVDLALRTGHLSGLPGHIAQTLFSSPWCTYATPDYLRRRGTPSTPGELAAHDLIGFRNSGDGRIKAWRFQDPAVDGAGGIVRPEARARIVFDDGAAAYDMACNGHGIVWAPEWLALDDLKGGRVVEVLRAWRSGEMRMSLVRRERRLTPTTHPGGHELPVRGRPALAGSRKPGTAVTAPCVRRASARRANVSRWARTRCVRFRGRASDREMAALGR